MCNVTSAFHTFKRRSIISQLFVTNWMWYRCLIEDASLWYAQMDIGKLLNDGEKVFFKHKFKQFLEHIGLKYIFVIDNNKSTTITTTSELNWDEGKAISFNDAQQIVSARLPWNYYYYFLNIPIFLHIL